MILAGHQPEYLPYLGFFHKMVVCDKFILVNHVQYQKKKFENRNKIRTAHGSDGWTLLTVPVKTHGRFYQKINQVEINNEISWAEKHWKTIDLNYKKAPFFQSYSDFFEALYKKKWEKLVELNESIIRYIAKELGINVEILSSSDYNFEKQKDELLIEMCQKLGADTYLSGEGGAKYVDENKFKKADIKHIVRIYKHPVYEQRYKPFVPFMSTIDLLFNHGEKSLKILTEENEINRLHTGLPTTNIR